MNKIKEILNDKMVFKIIRMALILFMDSLLTLNLFRHFSGINVENIYFYGIPVGISAVGFTLLFIHFVIHKVRNDEKEAN